MRENAIREAYILKQLNHDNIIQFIDLFEDLTYVSIVLEFMDCSI